jgi:hypothetical protein
LGRGVVCFSLLCLSACVSPLANYSGYAPAREYSIPCDQGYVFAAKALKANGFAISEVERGTGSGVVVGIRESAAVRRMEMRLSCTASGLSLTPSGETPYAENGLRIAFERIAESGATTKRVPQQLEVEAELITDPETKLYFSGPLAAVALRVRVANGTARPFEINPSTIVLRAESGASEQALARAEIERRFSSVMTAPAPRLFERVRLAPGESVEGFLIYPSGRYVAAVVRLTDVETSEPEEFETAFQSPPAT